MHLILAAVIAAFGSKCPRVHKGVSPYSTLLCPLRLCVKKRTRSTAESRFSAAENSRPRSTLQR